MNKLIINLKENDQDFEWYPTTDEILQVIYRDIANTYSRYGNILDIGCGNGKLYSKFKEWSEPEIEKSRIAFAEHNPYYNIREYYVIEKSKILIDNLPKEAIVVGTDFYKNTLIDKNVDAIFCNPPYSDFINWTCKIIKEANAEVIYLVIPQRWKESKEIKEYLNLRSCTFNILGEFDFLNAERRARAKVDIVKITLNGNSDPFDHWFEKEFKIKAKTDKRARYDEEIKEREVKKKAREQEIITSGNLIHTLVQLYNKDMSELYCNYKKLGELDEEIFEELNVNITSIKKNIKSRIEGIKNLYWKDLFDRIDSITSRLTTSSRSSLLSKLYSKTNIDFNEENIYAVVLWAIKNANTYFDQQLIEIFKTLTEIDNIRNYKSNQKTWEQEKWRYLDKDKISHYTLDYRVIINSYSKDIIHDLTTIADNLGFAVDRECRIYINDSGGSKEYAYLKNKKVLFEYKIYKNNNIHIKFDIEFIKALNIEASRLLGWIKSPKEAEEEFCEEHKVSEQEAGKYFKSSYLIPNVQSVLLLSI